MLTKEETEIYTQTLAQMADETLFRHLVLVSQQTAIMEDLKARLSAAEELQLIQAEFFKRTAA